jgi:ABC-type uncharacterized transport system ATPase subunit
MLHILEEPGLLVLDEPFNGLDEDGEELVRGNPHGEEGAAAL